MAEQGQADKFVIPKELGLKLATGQLTLGEFVHLSKDAQYAIAQIGHDLFKSGALDKALAIYQGLVASNPRDSVFNCHLGATYFGLEQFDQALHYFTQALRWNPSHVDALAGRGELLLRTGHITEAVNDLAAAVKADAGQKRPSAQRAAATLMLLNEAAKEKS